MSMRKARQKLNALPLQQRVKQRLRVPCGYLTSTTDLPGFSLIDLVLSVKPAYSIVDMIKDFARYKREMEQS
jgi:hypothetical protein